MILAAERWIWNPRYLDLSHVEVIMILEKSLDGRQVSSNTPTSGSSLPDRGKSMNILVIIH
jgi:hypothetical protein